MFLEPYFYFFLTLVDADESTQDTSQDASFESKNDAEKQEKKENENVQLMEDLKLPVKVRKSHSVKSMKRKNIVLEKIKELKIIEGKYFLIISLFIPYYFCNFLIISVCMPPEGW